MLKRPIQHLEIGCREDDSANSQPEKSTTNVKDSETASNPQSKNHDPQTLVETSRGRPRRSAAIEAQDRILGWVTD